MLQLGFKRAKGNWEKNKFRNRKLHFLWRRDDGREIFLREFFVIEKWSRLIDSLYGGQKDNKDTTLESKTP